MTDNWAEVDDVAMRALFDKEDAGISYEEWFAMRLVNHHMGDTDAVIFTSGHSLPGKTADSNPAEGGSSPSTRANTQKKRDEALKKTVLDATKTRKTAKNTDKIKKSTVSKPPSGVMADYGVSPVEAMLPDAELTSEMLEEAKASISPNADRPIDLPPDTDPEDITPDMFGLTPKQLQFCWEYIKDFNGARAVRDAGYSTESKGAQTTQANKLVTNGDVQHCMSQLMKLRRDRVKRKPSASELAKSADLVLERVAQLASFDMADFIKIGKDGLPFYDFSEATPEQLRGLTGLKVKQGVKMEFGEDGEPEPIPFYDVEAKGNSIKATELLMRHHGLLTERIEIEDKRDLEPKDVARRLAFMLQKAKTEKENEK